MYQNLNNTMNPLEENLSKANADKKQDNLLQKILILGLGIFIGVILDNYFRSESSHIDIEDYLKSE